MNDAVISYHDIFFVDASNDTYAPAVTTAVFHVCFVNQTPRGDGRMDGRMNGWTGGWICSTKNKIINDWWQRRHGGRLKKRKVTAARGGARQRWSAGKRLLSGVLRHFKHAQYFRSILRGPE